jgi:hypothetical protein
MTLFAVKEMYAKFPENQPHVIHFRTSTAHGVCPELTHPFIISKTSPISTEYEGKGPVLFHNGIWSSWEEKTFDFFLKTGNKIPDGAWSDSRALAIILGQIGMNALSFINGKFVILTPEDIIIKPGGDFERDDGIAFSNGGYKRFSNAGTCGYNQPWTSEWEKKNAKKEEDSKEDEEKIRVVKKNGGTRCPNISETVTGRISTETLNKIARAKGRREGEDLWPLNQLGFVG